MMKEYKGDFVAIGLDCKGAKQNFLDMSTNVARMTSFHIDQLPPEDSKSWTRKQWDAISTFLEENRKNIFYLFLFYVITIALFVERFICESHTHTHCIHTCVQYLEKRFAILNVKISILFVYYRLLFHDGTYGPETYNGRGDRNNQRFCGRSVLLLQSFTIDDVT